MNQFSTLAKLLAQSEELPITPKTQQRLIETWLHQNKLTFTVKSFQNSVHLRSIKHGFQVEFQNGKFNTFFAYFRSEKIGCMQFPVLFDINKGWTIKGAVMYLGEPPQKSNRLVQIIYPHLGLGLVFLGGWSNENSLINYAYLYTPQKIQVCAGCGKEYERSTNQSSRLYNQLLKVSICKCEYVTYCSEKCEKKHYGHHLIFCEKGEP